MPVAARRAGVVVVGGGLAGAMAAAHLARAGVPVVVCEQSVRPQPRVCGEFLSFEGAALLRDIGIDLPAAAPAIATVAVHGPHRTLVSRLPGGNVGVSRLWLDEALRQRAGELGASIHRGVTVQRIMPRPGSGALVQTSDGDWDAEAVVVATGKRDLRGVAARERVSDVVGVQLHVSVTPEVRVRLQGRVELWVGEGAYGGAALVDGTTLNVSCVIAPAVARDPGLVASHLMPALMRRHTAAARVLAGIDWPETRMTAVAPVPYGYIRPEAPGPGIFCVGDQLAVIPSLTGDGMTIALASGREAGRLLASGWGKGWASARRDAGAAGGHWEADPGRAMRLAEASRQSHECMAQAFRRQLRVAVWLQRLFAQPRVLEGLLRAGAWLPPVVPLLMRATRVPHGLRAREARRAPAGSGRTIVP